MSVTKNHKEEKVLHQMMQAAFPNKKIESIQELTEGYFNVAYAIKTTEGMEVILKIAPPSQAEVMTYEKNIMFSEVDSMRCVAEKTHVPIAKIFFYDQSKTLCDSEYFFMEKLEGGSFSGCQEMLTEAQKEKISFQIGIYTAEINAIEGKIFGYYGQKDKQGSNWYAVFKSILEDIYEDAKRKAIHLKVTKEKLYERLEKDKEAFEEVRTPKLVHWDIWAGNIFVVNDTITGIIDFERCLWGDPLMEVGFRTYSQEKAFLQGYGVHELTKNEKIRAEWYDIYLFLEWCIEGTYRLYDTDDLYQWGSKQLMKWINK